MYLKGALRFCFILSLLVRPAGLVAQSPPQSSSARQSSKKMPAAADDGIVNSVYRNKRFAFSYKIPEGWVLRTDEMNARQESQAEKAKNDQPTPAPATSTGAKVLLAAFSRPPEARGEDVNASVVIAVERTDAYPGLKEPWQYFGPLTEVATAQGFQADEEPYEVIVGNKRLARGDFHKDVGSRVMHQSTLVALSRGYALSITVIGGTDDEVESLIDALTFTGK